MKLMFASDSFKGSLSSERTAELLERATAEVFPGAETDRALIADGGEGTTDALVKELGGERVYTEAEGPLSEPVTAYYGILPGGASVIESAQASGLPLVRAEERDPLKTSSCGTGQLICDALDRGIRKITIALGGSATNDGGMGALRALGARFTDLSGYELYGRGEELERVRSIDISGMHPAVSETEFTIMCDVTNPLLGERGAARVFAPQKGADASAVERLENGMRIYAEAAARTLSHDYSKTPGAGAAGGLGFAFMAFLGARPVRGIDAVLDLVGFDERLEDTDLVITGEGCLDSQSSQGKVLYGIGERCKKHGVPAAAIVGGVLNGYESIYRHGIISAVTTVNGIMSIDEAMERSEELYFDAALRLFRLVKCGMDIGLR